MDELLKRARSTQVVILDTRPARECIAGHIPGALSFPVDDLQRRLKELTKNREYVAYCRGPYCIYADRAVEILRANGRRARRLVFPSRALKNATFPGTPRPCAAARSTPAAATSSSTRSRNPLALIRQSPAYGHGPREIVP